MSDLIQSLQQINSEDACYDYLALLANELELKTFWYIILPRSFNSQASQPPLMLVNNYPKEFVEDYVKNQRYLLDPISKRSFMLDNAALFWPELLASNPANDQELKELEWASSYDIKNGLSCPISSKSECSLLHFVIKKENKKKLARLQQLKNLIPMISQLLFTKTSSLIQGLEFSRTHNRLTARESECLQWAAKGKTIWETSKILNLANATVNEYLSKSLKKLKANSKAQAVAKAILYKQIDSEDVLNYLK